MAFYLMAGNSRMGRPTGKQRRGQERRVGCLENDPSFWGFWLPQVVGAGRCLGFHQHLVRLKFYDLQRKINCCILALR